MQKFSAASYALARFISIVRKRQTCSYLVVVYQVFYGCFDQNQEQSSCDFTAIIYCWLSPVQYVHRSTTPQAWHQYSQYNKDRAEAEMRASVTLREAIDATLAETRNELEAQRIATEFAYRKRVHEMERAEGELVWQEEKVILRSFFCI